MIEDKAIAIIDIYYMRNCDVYSYIKSSLNSFGYTSDRTIDFGDFHLRFKYLGFEKFKITLFIFNRDMLKNVQVRELLLEYLI